MPDDFICSRGTTANEKRLISTEYPRRIPPPLGDRARMVEQRSECTDGHRNIGSQRVLAEKLIEQIADRALPEGHATAMARSVPGIARMQRIVHQRLEHRRWQAFEIEPSGASDHSGDEFRRV